MKHLRTRLALWIAPWLKQPTSVYFPTVYSSSATPAVTFKVNQPPNT